MNIVNEHPHIARVKQGYENFATGEMTTLIQLFAADAIWHSPGHNPISGDYQGVNSILDYFSKFSALSQKQFQVELIDVLANDGRAVVLTRDTVTLQGKTFSWEGGVIFQFCDDKVIEAWAFNCDQYWVDEFWNAQDQALRPKPVELRRNNQHS